MTSAFTALCLFLSIVFGACSGQGHAPDRIVRAGSFPQDDTAFAQGTSALYCGVSEGRLLLAGGCNFPDVPAAGGGPKRYYDHVYASVPGGDSLRWEAVGRLPVPSAYGVAVSAPRGVVVAGGMNAEGPLRSVFTLRLDGGMLRTDTLAPLPCTLDNMGGDLLGDRFFLAGGNCDGTPSNRVFVLDLGRPDSGWEEIPPFPGLPRVQPVVAVTPDALYLFGGFYAASTAGGSRVAPDGLRFDFASASWAVLGGPVADGDSCTLTGASMLRLSDTLLLAVGGVNREVFFDAITGRYALTAPADYLRHPIPWYRFNRRMFFYHTLQDRWTVGQADSLLGRAGAALVRDGSGEVLLVGGEVKPGVRTPSVCRLYPL